MSNDINTPTSFYFSLSFKDESSVFQEMSGISASIEVKESTSTDENRFTYKLPSLPKFGNLVLKRAIIPKTSQLLKWCKSSTEALSNSIETNSIVVHLLSQTQEILVEWTFYQAFPIKYNLLDLNGQDNEVVIESIEFAYTYFET